MKAVPGTLWQHSATAHLGVVRFSRTAFFAAFAFRALFPFFRIHLKRNKSSARLVHSRAGLGNKSSH